MRPNIKNITRSLADRAIHLRITPRPATIAESREMLRVLQRFGNVEMYRNLRYDSYSAPSTALAVVQDRTMAKKLCRMSPLRFTLERAEGGEIGEAHMAAGQSEEAMQGQKQQGHVEEADLEPGSEEEYLAGERAALGHFSPTQRPIQKTSDYRAPHTVRPQQVQEYQLQISHATVDHHDRIQTNQFHGPFAVDTKSAAQGDLVQRVPLLGLSDIDIRKMEKPYRVLERERFYERKKWKTLRELWTEGQVTREDASLERQVRRIPDDSSRH